MKWTESSFFMQIINKYDDDKLFNCQENCWKLLNSTKQPQPNHVSRRCLVFTLSHLHCDSLSFSKLPHIEKWYIWISLVFTGFFKRCNYAILIAHVINHFFFVIFCQVGRVCACMFWLIQLTFFWRQVITKWKKKICTREIELWARAESDSNMYQPLVIKKR